MTQASTYALLSAGAYTDIREDRSNRAPLPEGWKVLTQYDAFNSGGNASLLGSGFSARVYQGPGNEIVIAYAGTESGNNPMGAASDWVSGNVPLATGLYGAQAYEAARLYQQVKADVAAGTLSGSISFTGHSLGGGLAGLMAVWFDRPATVFAPAPFENSASSVIATTLGPLSAMTRVRAQLAAIGYSDAAFNSYLSLTDFSAREVKVDSITVQGEVLSKFLAFLPFIQNSSARRLYTNAGDELGSIDKHSIDLHAAALLVTNFENQSSKLKWALPLLFSEKLYGYNVTGGTDPNLLVKLIRGEVGVRSDTGLVTTPANAMLTHFSNDLGKLEAVGLAKMSEAGQQAVLAQGMEWYYWQDSGAYAGAEFAVTSGNLLQFNSAAGDGLLGGTSRAQPWMKTWLEAVYKEGGGSDYPAFGMSYQQWSVATEVAVVANARDVAKTQLFVGAGGADNYTGGDKDDVLFGGGGADTLDGGQGQDLLSGGKGDDSLVGGGADDELRGGEGSDTYSFTGAFGEDIIVDDGSGLIIVDGQTITGTNSFKLRDGVYEDNDFTYAVVSTDRGATDLLMRRKGALDSILIRDWASGKLGMSLRDVVAPAPTIEVIKGDFKKAIIGSEYDLGPNGYDKDGLEANAEDLLLGTSQDDTMQGLGGSDILFGNDGDDTIEGGDGGDVLLGGWGADSINGGAGNDFIAGSAYGDVIRPIRTDFTPPAADGTEMERGFSWVIYDQPDTDPHIDRFGYRGFNAAPNGERDTNLISAGDGDDRVYAGSGADVAHGDGGADWLYGLAGADVLYGDEGNDSLFGDGEATPGSAAFTPNDEHGNDVLVGGGGDDQLVGQGGEDELFGGAGNDNIWGDDDDAARLPNELHANDYLDGGDGVDQLVGGGGDDELWGGSGNDNMFGDDNDTVVAGAFHGDDYLNGETGNDTLVGGGGADTLIGGDGADAMVGDDEQAKVPLAFQGADYMDGGLGNDSMFGDGGDDTLFGGEGDDQVSGDTSETQVALSAHGNDYVDGGAGNDIVDGNGGDDTLLGGAGLDTLHGGAGDDVLQGGSDADLMDGGDGNDRYVIAAGEASQSAGSTEGVNDSSGNDLLELQGFSTTTLMFGVSGDDLTLNDGADQWVVIGGGLSGSIESYVIGDEQYGFSELLGRFSSAPLLGTDSEGHARAFGGYGDDNLYSSGSDALLSGGLGNDTLIGDGGNNTYRYDRNGGVDVIVDRGGSISAGGALPTSRIQFGAGISASSLQLSAEGANLLINVGDASLGNQLRIDGFSGSTGASPINEFSFEDGTSLTLSQLLARGTDMAGSSASEVQIGTYLEDRFGASGGADTLMGGAGADTYRFGSGSGTDFIQDGDASAAIDTVVMGDGISQSTVTVGRSADNLILRLTGNAADVLTVQGHFSGTGIERVVFSDGSVWLASDIESRVVNELTEGPDAYTGTALADVISGRNGDDTISGLGGDDLINGDDGSDVLQGDAGNDTLNGGAGTDTLRGSAGSDTYLLARAIGQDVIDGAGGLSADVDEVRVGTGISTADVRMVADTSGNQQTIEIKSSTDSLTFYNVAQNYGNVQRIVFADGTTWNRATWLQRALDDKATEGNDTIRGYDSIPGIIQGLGGDDNLSGGSGDDTVDGGAGIDTLFGNAGNDTLVNGELMYGDAGDDTFDLRSATGGNRVSDTMGNDALLLPTDFSPDSVKLTRGWNSTSSGSDDLIISNASGTKSVYVDRFFLSQLADYKIEMLRFTDGTVWSSSDVFNRVISSVATTGGDTLYGYRWNDSIAGLSGNDVIDGGSGDDTLNGGSGNDSVLGGVGNDAYLYARGDGLDLLTESSGTDKLVMGAGIAQTDVTLFRLGNDLVVAVDQSATQQITVAGYYSSTGNQIERIDFPDGSFWDASAIASRIVAGTANAMIGTAGNDTFIVDNAGDTVTEAAGQGTDVVQSSVHYSLGANIENLTLTGYLSTRGTGNDLGNTITGNAANNVLDGLTGSDTLIGGAGDDTYYVVGLEGDVVVEQSNQGADVVVLTPYFDYILPENVENLTAEANFSGTSSVRLTGNALNNVIRGRSRGADTLDGGGGADTIIGASYCTNTYVIDSLDDVVIDPDIDDGDVVQSSVGYVLSDKLEQLVLTGASAISGTGNSRSNVLDGSQNSASNMLAGGEGNDVYRVDAIDQVVEQMGGGFDTVVVVNPLAGTYVKSNYANTEVIRLTGGYAGANVIGTAGNDQIVGSAYANRLDGGAGDDYIIDNNDSLYATMENARDELIGGDGEDHLLSWGGMDTLDGGHGDDVLESRGYASFLFGYGDGHDVAYIGTSGWPTFVKFKAGIDASNVQVTRSDTKLTLTLASTGDSIEIVDAFADGVSTTFRGGGIWLLFEDGEQLMPSAVLKRLDTNNANVVTSGGDVLLGSGFFDTLLGAAGDDLILGLAGDDSLSGNLGADELHGGLGNDSYTFSRGDGADDLYETGGDDKVVFAAGILTSDVTISRDGDYLILSVAGATDRITIHQFFAAQDNEIESVQFADGTVWSGTYLRDASSRIDGTAGADSLTGTVSADRMFGLAGNDTLRGNDGDDTLDGGAGNDSLVGGTGDDTYVVDSASDVVLENANEGTDTVNAAVAWTLGSNLENLTLTGTSAINGTGNTLNNVLIGNSANNSMSGGTGADTLIGGFGNDTYTVDNTSDVITELVGEGIDAVSSSVTYTLAANVENLTLTGATTINGTGNTLDNVLTGNSANNTLTGGAGNDTIDGGTGNDTMEGGTGNDTYVVNVSTDLVTELAGEGTDTVQSGVTLTLAANVENLTLTGTTAINGTGNTLDNVLTGNTANNSLTGAAGNDTLDGGTGNDTMLGGAGNDSYFVNVSTDAVTENANEGTDTVNAAVTWTLGANIENLVLTGAGAINGTGNTLNNVLTGNNANNSLSGGTGADSLIGGQGNDTYTVDNTGDVITELAGEGTDAVSSSVTFTLAANVENLTLTGTTAINGTGNTLDNVLTGNSANNTLTGGVGNDTLDGGTGNDTMVGGIGNDTYVVNIATDVVTELANEGTDTVQSSVTLTLAANVENLTLTGTSAINGTGNTLDNILTGNSANNTLTGGAGNDSLDGGTGNDTMVGGAGNDTYVVNIATDVVTELANEGADTVQSSVTLTLAANVENLTLTGTTAINGTGNALDNWLIGNSANNTLTGAAGNDTMDGGAGNDTMLGGAGNDSYFVNVSTDVVTENASEGTDTVNAAVTWTLGNNLENLTLTGTTAINGTGNTLDNWLTGSSAANTLTGGAGADTLDGAGANDILIGGAGADSYRFGRSWGIDTVQENDATAGVKDLVVLQGTVTQADVQFSQVGNNLEMLINGTTDKLVFTNWYLGSQYHAEEFRFTDGTVLTDSQAQGLVGAMAAFAAPASAGATTVTSMQVTVGSPNLAANALV